MVNMKETIIEITVIAVGVILALYLMNYMGYIQHNSGGIRNQNVPAPGIRAISYQQTETRPSGSSLAWTGSD